MSRRTLARFSVALALALPVAAHATGHSAGPPSVVTAFAYDFYPGDGDAIAPQPLRVVEGGGLVFLNMDPLDYHTVTSAELGENGTPLFGTARDIGIGEFELVDGVDRLQARAEPYPFICTRHPFMTGEISVVRALPE